MKRISIFDDDPEIISLVSYLLQHFGYTVQASSKTSVVRDVYRFRPGLILFDIWKRNSEEILLLKQLKRDKNTADIPIILFSTAPNLAELASLCETEYFLAKPFDIDEFVALVDSIYLSYSQAK